MKRFNNKVILIAGAGGIGSATALRLASEGAKVAIGSVTGASAERTADQINFEGGQAVGFKLDLASEKSVAKFVAESVAKFGGVDGLFNVAAVLTRDIIGRDRDAVTTPVDVWQHTLDVNLTGYWHTIRYVIPELLKRGGGAIVNTLSASAYAGETRRVAYGVSKAGLTALTRHVANRWGKEGIHCNGLSPGAVCSHGETCTPKEIMDRTWRGMASTRDGIPSPRLAVAEDVAAAAAFLLSDESWYINGQSIGIDGGLIFR